MQRQRDILRALRGAGIWAGFALLLMVVLVVVCVAVKGFRWELFFQALCSLRLVFPVMLAFVFILAFLVLRFPIYNMFVMLLVVALAFLLASMKNNPISQQISEYIHTQFEVELFAAAITMLALVSALFEVYRRSRIIEDR